MFVLFAQVDPDRCLVHLGAGFAFSPCEMLLPVGTEVLGAVSDSFCACGAGLFLWQGKCEARLAESR